MNRARIAFALAILATSGSFVLNDAWWRSTTARWADPGLLKQVMYASHLGFRIATGWVPGRSRTKRLSLRFDVRPIIGNTRFPNL
jgi:hypothetical protein